MNRKGDGFQMLVGLILIFIVAITGLLFYVLTKRVNDYWDSSGLLNSTQTGIQAINNIQDTAPRSTDYAIFFMFLGVNIGVVIGAVRTNFSYTMLIFFVFLMLISIMIAAGFVNMYQGLAQQPSIIDASGQLHLTNFLFSKYLPLIISVLSALVMLIMYGKGGNDIIP